MTNSTRLFDFIDNIPVKFPSANTLNAKENGQWVAYSSQEFKDIAYQYALALYQSGIRKNDKIAIISNNRPEWNFCDFGIQLVGAVSVPIYPTSSANDLAYIINNAEIKIVIVSDKNLYEKILKIKETSPNLKAIYCFDNIEGLPHVSDLLSMADSSQINQIEEIKKTVQPDDLVTIIYTSGTTGNPKGVMLSHRNILFNVNVANNFIPLTAGQLALSFLPLCHIFERVATYYYISAGIKIYYAESIDALRDNLQEIKPHFFTCVPRLLEKIHSGIIAKGQELSGIKKMLYYWGIRLAHMRDARSRLAYPLLDKLIYSEWRAALGDNVVGVVTGAAALMPKLDIFFNNIGINVREAYGMTEAAPGISANTFRAGESKNGTVGPILKGVKLKLDHREGMGEGEGEILIQGENIMLGYYNNPEATAATFRDEWFCTGDVGKIVDGKFLKITDRVKELFKTSGGKYVAPQYLENKLKESKYIEQIIVVGNDRKFVAAIIFPSASNFANWAKYKKISLDTQDPNWIKNELVKAKINKEIDRFNEQFSQIEKIKQFRLINEEWTIDKGELTPTLKLKRKVIEAKYAQLIEEIYQE